MLYVRCRDERRDGLPHTGEMHAVIFIFSFRSVAHRQVATRFVG